MAEFAAAQILCTLPYRRSAKMSGYAFASTEPAPDFLRMTIELGAACCLRKPFTPNALLTTVNQCLNKPTASARLKK